MKILGKKKQARQDGNQSISAGWNIHYNICKAVGCSGKDVREEPRNHEFPWLTWG